MKTSEYVALGHPDKIADYISEYILDRYLEKDKYVRYALEVQIKDNFVTLAGEITTTANISSEDRAKFVKEAVRDVGYTHEYATKWPTGATLDADLIEVTEHISEQSTDIAHGVNLHGWGDQGIFHGMAVNDPIHDNMPLDYWLAKKIGKLLYNSKIGGLDIKTQVTIDSDKVKEVIIAIPTMTDITDKVKMLIDPYMPNSDYILIVNGTGAYVQHGPQGDCGTTGRKLVVDFYGGNCKIGGGCPWTKDPSKADLTLNVYARHLAVQHMKMTNMKECYVAISCCIGKKKIYVSIYDECNRLVKQYEENNDAEIIISQLSMRTPNYAYKCKEGLFE